MIKITFDPFTPLSILETRQQHRYTYTEIAEKGGMSKQLARHAFSGNVESPAKPTLEGLLNFFTMSDMPITINDLFVIENDSSN